MDKARCQYQRFFQLWVQRGDLAAVLRQTARFARRVPREVKNLDRGTAWAGAHRRGRWVSATANADRHGGSPENDTAGPWRALHGWTTNGHASTRRAVLATWASHARHAPWWWYGDAWTHARRIASARAWDARGWADAPTHTC